MSASDWLMLGVVGPAVIAGAWLATFLVWRRGPDASVALGWATRTSSGAGYNAYLLPASVFMTLIWFSMALDIWWRAHGQSPEWVENVVSWALAGAGFALVIAVSEWLFMRPRFLVPPRFRGEPGWVRAAWRSRRERRSVRENRVDHTG